MLSDLGHILCVKWYLTVILINISLIAKWVWHIFICILPVWVFYEMPFTHTSKGFFKWNLDNFLLFIYIFFKYFLQLFLLLTTELNHEAWGQMGLGLSLSGRKATSHSSSWDELIQELSNLMLNSGSIQPPLLQERAQEKEKSPKQRQQKNKRMFQRLLKEWKD